MKCIHLDSKKCKGEIINMASASRRSQQNNGNQGTIPINFREATVTMPTVVFGAICIIVFVFVSWAALEIISLDKITTAHKTEIDNLKGADFISANVTSLQEDIDKITKVLYGNPDDESKGLQEEIAALQGEVDVCQAKLEVLLQNSISATGDVTSSIEQVSKEPNDLNIVTSSITADTCLGTDIKGRTYYAKDSVNELLLLSYEEDGKEVFFLGQYNENYKWDGYCITNAYNSDGSLSGICESNFEDGKRLDYKSFVRAEEKNEWIYSDKLCEEEINNGINIRYALKFEQKKNFTETNTRVADILYVDSFVETYKPRMLTFYRGNTIEGRYSDDTGKAYQAIYDADGNIRTLYVGKFSSGTFNDSTGDAWCIAYSDDGFYVCNKGGFVDGHALQPCTEPISFEEIQEIVSEYDFECELEWKK